MVQSPMTSLATSPTRSPVSSSSFEERVVAAGLTVAALAGGPQQSLRFPRRQPLQLDAFLSAHGLQLSGGVCGEELILPRPSEELFQRLDTAVDSRSPQLFRAQHVLTILDEIDRADAA